MRNFFGNLMDSMRNNKGVTYIIGLMVALVLGVFLYTTLRTPSDVAITEATKEVTKETEVVEDEVKKTSKGLDFKVPMAEDVQKFIAEKEAVDGDLEADIIDTLILDEYGSEVVDSIASGMLPSNKLTSNQNKVQIDNIKSYFIEDYVGTSTTAWDIDTSGYIYGEESLSQSATSYLINKGYLLENASQFFNVGDISVGGFNVYAVNVDDINQNNVNLPESNMEGIQYNLSGVLSDMNDPLFDDYDKTYLTELGNQKTVTAVSYYVKPLEDISTDKFFKQLSKVELTVNENAPLEPMADDNLLKANYILGSAYTKLVGAEDKTIPSSNYYTVTQYIPTNVLSAENTLSVNGNSNKLKAATGSSSIDLTKAYTE